MSRVVKAKLVKAKDDPRFPEKRWDQGFVFKERGRWWFWAPGVDANGNPKPGSKMKMGPYSSKRLAEEIKQEMEQGN
jgi:hypothetical protein